MVIVDTSVWVDYLRGTSSSADTGLRALIDEGADLATTEPIVMEILAGARDERVLGRLETLVDGLTLLSVDPRLDFRAAATLYRACRTRGETVRRLVDCLIAAVALRHDVVLLHNDADFDVLASHTPLQARSLR